MRKLFFFIIILSILGFFIHPEFKKKICPIEVRPDVTLNDGQLLKDGLALLKGRKDKEALVYFEFVLANSPENQEALWGKAEALRRSRDYKAAEIILNKILEKNSGHFASLNSLSYLKYKFGDYKKAADIASRVLACAKDKENRALAFMMLGTVNSKRAQESILFGKCVYGPKIKGNLLKARELAPELPEVRLALGTFYLLAPRIIGGNVDSAFSELREAVRLAPDFATANARLAQAYAKKDDKAGYERYVRKAKELDPENEVIAELSQ